MSAQPDLYNAQKMTEVKAQMGGRTGDPFKAGTVGIHFLQTRSEPKREPALRPFGGEQRSFQQLPSAI